MPTPQLTVEMLNAAIEGFESQKRRIDEQIAEIRQMLNGNSAEPASASKPQTHRRRKMSAAGRKAIAEAQRKRWAASKGESEPVTTKKKHKLSAAGKVAIVAALKKRWAAKKAGATAAKQSARKAAPRNAAAKEPITSQ
jgi:hypothetical protein